MLFVPVLWPQTAIGINDRQTPEEQSKKGHGQNFFKFGYGEVYG